MKRASLFFYLLIAGFIFLLPACSDDSEPTQQGGPNLNAVIAADAQFSMMLTAMERSNLGPTLEGRGPYTVFVPSNEAFEDFLAASGVSSLTEIPSNQLSRQLLPHIIQDRVPGSAITEGYIQTLAVENNSLNSVTLYINMLTGINGLAFLGETDIEASNGLIHVVDAVIPYPHLWTHLGTNPEFGVFFEALNRVNTFIQEPLEHEGPFTVFAPNNAAMLDFLNNSGWDALDQIPVDTLWSIVATHFVPNRNLLARQFEDNLGLNTLSPNEATLSLFEIGGEVVISADGANSIPIEIVNLQAANGIIHMITEVAIP